IGHVVLTTPFVTLVVTARLLNFDRCLEWAGADLGANPLQTFRHITLPTILPLILINFVGAFIATFQTMGNIFLLTFGGPGKETMVMGLAIWQSVNPLATAAPNPFFSLNRIDKTTPTSSAKRALARQPSCVRW
ncbi:MAG: ABC transporter permease subunit, partial [Verrucomicrobiota bacterium]